MIIVADKMKYAVHQDTVQFFLKLCLIKYRILLDGIDTDEKIS